MKNNIQYKVPRLKTVNLEIRDFDYYINDKFDEDKIDFDFDFKINLKKSKVIQIFIHLQYSFLEKSTKKEEVFFPLFHSDHIINFELIKSPKGNKTFEVEYLAHLLGISIVMIKGYYDNITKGYKINTIPLPVFNPMELINVKYDEVIKGKLFTFAIKK